MISQFRLRLGVFTDGFQAVRHRFLSFVAMFINREILLLCNRTVSFSICFQLKDLIEVYPVRCH